MSDINTIILLLVVQHTVKGWAVLAFAVTTFLLFIVASRVFWRAFTSYMCTRCLFLFLRSFFRCLSLFFAAVLLMYVLSLHVVPRLANPGYYAMQEYLDIASKVTTLYQPQGLPRKIPCNVYGKNEVSNDY